MPGKKPVVGCDPKTIIEDHPHKHSLLCNHHAYLDERRGKVVYIEGEDVHENCPEGHTHRSPICLKHEFTKVAKPDEDCSKRTDCHIHIRKDGAAELHHPAEPGAKNRACQKIAVLKPLT